MNNILNETITLSGRKIIHNREKINYNSRESENLIRSRELNAALSNIETFICHNKYCNNDELCDKTDAITRMIYEGIREGKYKEFDIFKTTTPMKKKPFIWKLKYRPEKQVPIIYLFYILNSGFLEYCKTENLGKIYYIFVALILDSLGPEIKKNEETNQRLESESLAVKELKNLKKNGTFTFATKNYKLVFKVNTKNKTAYLDEFIMKDNTNKFEESHGRKRYENMTNNELAIRSKEQAKSIRDRKKKQKDRKKSMKKTKQNN